MDIYITKLKEEDFTTSNWSGGKTTQLYIYPENSNFEHRDFKVRISSATVELKESYFTKLEGVQRFITPLDVGLKLTHDDENFTVLKTFEIYKFEGNLDTKSYGKVSDFNLMLANGAKGELKNFYIDDKKEIIMLNAGLNILYSYDSLFQIDVAEKEFKLFPNELLVLEFDTKKQIHVCATKPSNLLISSIKV